MFVIVNSLYWDIVLLHGDFTCDVIVSKITLYTPYRTLSSSTKPTI